MNKKIRNSLTFSISMLLIVLITGGLVFIIISQISSKITMNDDSPEINEKYSPIYKEIDEFLKMVKNFNNIPDEAKDLLKSIEYNLQDQSGSQIQIISSNFIQLLKIFNEKEIGGEIQQKISLIIQNLQGGDQVVMQ